MAVFRVLINLGLRLVGAEYSQQAIDDELDFIESYYGPHVCRILPMCSALIRRNSHLMVPMTRAGHTITTQLHSLSHSIPSFTPDLQDLLTQSEPSDIESEQFRISQR